MRTPGSAYARLWREPGAARLLTSSVAGRLPASMCALGLLLLLRDRAGIGQAALALSVYTFGEAAAMPVVGRLADRYGPRAVLVPTGLVHPLLLLALVAVADSPSTPLVLVVALLAGLTWPPVGPCGRALWPRVARSEGVLATAFAADAVATEVVWILGPLLLGVLVAVASPGWALCVAAALALSGTLLLAAHPAARGLTGLRESHHTASGSVLRLPVVRGLLATVLGSTTGVGIVLVAIPATAPDAGEAGLLVAVWGLGSAGAGLWAGTRGWTGDARALVRLSVVAAMLLLPLAVAGSAPLLLVGALLVLAGAPLAPVSLTGFGLVTSAVPEHLRTSAFAWLTTTSTIGISIGSAVAGLLLPAGVAGDGDLALVYGVAALVTLAGGLALRLSGQGQAATTSASRSATATSAV